MGIIEAILIGIQFKRLEKPIVFLSMLICFLAFTVFGIVILLAGFEAIANGKEIISTIGIASFSLIFFGLSAICGYFIKKCIKA